LIKEFLKSIAVFFGLVIMAPPAATCWLERRFCSGDRVFSSWAQFCALLPGVPGAYLRRSFYCLTLRSCSRDCHIGFLSLITSRETVIESGVYIGAMAVVGFALLGRGSLIGTRVGILNGGNQHQRLPDGSLTPFAPENMPRTHIGADTWIGEAAIVMADIGARCTVGAGSLVHRIVVDDSVVAGNPARLIRNDSWGRREN
jgi:acetyltransferase-like isoleucine patch superfamily enzyme